MPGIQHCDSSSCEAFLKYYKQMSMRPMQLAGSPALAALFPGMLCIICRAPPCISPAKGLR